VRCRTDHLAVGLLDGPNLLRPTSAPDGRGDEELAQQLVADVTAPERGVFMERKVNIEAPMDALVQSLLSGVTVWAADQGKPGLLEPMGVHRDHRGHGYGTAITVAAAAALQELGSSTAIVNTSTSNVGAVAMYRSAGFQQRPEVRDMCRDA
jgi:GNAT superfamily N-acetyltransferase